MFGVEYEKHILTRVGVQTLGIRKDIRMRATHFDELDVRRSCVADGFMDTKTVTRKPTKGFPETSMHTKSSKGTNGRPIGANDVEMRSHISPHELQHI